MHVGPTVFWSQTLYILREDLQGGINIDVEGEWMANIVWNFSWVCHNKTSLHLFTYT